MSVTGVETLRDEVVALLQELIRLNTVNPPGNETQAAELLRDYLVESGVEAQLVAREPSRANLVARLEGTGDGPSLGLLSHTDTVVADRMEWSGDPWSGEIRDGQVWGRGALDMKGQVAASAVALASLAREGFRPSGDLVFMAVADEEVGDAELGLPWLCREHPELVRVDYAVNEGGGERIVAGGKNAYVCALAEKRTSPFVLLVHGRSGHGSMPAIADNALVKAAAMIAALAAYDPEPRLIPEVEALFTTLTGEVPEPSRLLTHAREQGQLVAEWVEPLLGITLAPTIIHASERRNVIPGTCEVTVDCRLLPGQEIAEAEQIIRSVLGEGEYEISWLEGYGGTRSPLGTPLWDTVTGFVEVSDPEAVVLPLCTPGFTDSHWLRTAFGTVCHGFFPQRVMDAEVSGRLIHSADERIEADDLVLGLDFLRHAARTICA